MSADQEDNGGEFDRFDDEQLMSMFSDDCTAAPPTLLNSSASTPSDQNSNNEEKASAEMPQLPKTELLEVQSEGPPSSNDDTVTDPKRVKRYQNLS